MLINRQMMQLCGRSTVEMFPFPASSRTHPEFSCEAEGKSTFEGFTKTKEVNTGHISQENAPHASGKVPRERGKDSQACPLKT